LLIVSRIASNVGGTGVIERMRNVAGNCMFAARRRLSGGIVTCGVSKCATCPLACTPESVRDDPHNFSGCRTTLTSALRQISCTVGKCGCDPSFPIACHPW
jgi:hypothetical protein